MDLVGFEASGDRAASDVSNEMTRKKAELAWIPNDPARRASFKKRRMGVIKKASELSTLCDVQVAAIIFGPHEAAPEVWPSVEGATAALERFYAMPETEQTKKMMNHEKFLGDRIAKTSTQLEKAQRETNEAEYMALLFRCLADKGRVHELDITATMSLAWVVEMKMKTVRDRIEALTPTPLMLHQGIHGYPRVSTGDSSCIRSNNASDVVEMDANSGNIDLNDLSWFDQSFHN